MVSVKTGLPSALHYLPPALGEVISSFLLNSRVAWPLWYDQVAFSGISFELLIVRKEISFAAWNPLVGVICDTMLATRRVHEGRNINQIWKQWRISGLWVDQHIISSSQYQISECENRRVLWLNCLLTRLKGQSAGHPEGFESKYYPHMHNVNVINLPVICIS